MAAEYSYPVVQTVASGENVLFLNGSRCCKRGLITHTDNSGIFRIKGVPGCCSTIYEVHFNANVAISEDGTVEPISVALVQNGESLRNAIATVTPAAIGDFWNVSIDALIELPCGCCDTISLRNISETTDIDVINANIIIDKTR